MDDMRTSKQVLSSIENGINKLIKQFTPEEKEIQNEELIKDLAETVKESNRMLDTIHELSLQNKEVFDEKYLESFNHSRLNWFLSSAAILLLLTLWFYYLKTILFLLPAGFFVANLGILMMIYYDWKLTPGDSFARISKNPVALSVLMLVIAFFFYVGISVGEKYIPDSFGNEASQRIEARLDNIESKIDSEKQVPQAPPVNDGETGNGSGIPNR